MITRQQVGAARNSGEDFGFWDIFSKVTVAYDKIITVRLRDAMSHAFHSKRQVSTQSGFYHVFRSRRYEVHFRQMATIFHHRTDSWFNKVNIIFEEESGMVLKATSSVQRNNALSCFLLIPWMHDFHDKFLLTVRTIDSDDDFRWISFVQLSFK